MRVTDVRLRLVPGRTDNIRALVSITLDASFVIHDLLVIEANKKTFVAMPSKRMRNGEFRDIAHPINAETRQMISAAVLSAYYTELARMPAASFEEDANLPEYEFETAREFDLDAPQEFHRNAAKEYDLEETEEYGFSAGRKREKDTSVEVIHLDFFPESDQDESFA